MPKERGGDQGDALTNYIFPLTCKRVTASVRDAAQLGTDEARDYSYQDDLDIVCVAWKRLLQQLLLSQGLPRKWGCDQTS